MKHKKHNFIFLLLILASCKPTTQLSTSDSSVIDISGRWNQTDSEIALEKFKQDLVNSKWMLNQIKTNSFGFNVDSLQTEIDYIDSQDIAHFHKTLKQKLRLEIPKEKMTQGKSAKVFYDVVPSLKVKKNDDSNVLRYTLDIQIIDLGGEVEFHNTQQIKKYLKQ